MRKLPMRKVLAVLLLPLAACVDAEPVDAPGVAPPPVVGALPPPAGDQLVLPPGYAAAPVPGAVVDPRAVAFDAAGIPHVLEGEPARLSRVSAGGPPVPVATGGGNGPWTGVAWLDGRFHVAEAGGPLGGRILRVEPDGAVVPAVSGLPAGGLLGPLAAGPDGALYVGVATARAGQGGARDIPCQDLRLRNGGRLEGAVPCTGSVLRIVPGEGEVAVHAWGFTRPVGLAFTPDGRLLVADDLPVPDPTRPQLAAGDVLWQAVPGVWYGWPDVLGQMAVADPELAVQPNPPPPPVAALDGEAAAVAVPDRPPFGGGDRVFVTLTRRDEPGMVAFTDLETGLTVPFAANFDRPRALAFGPDQSLWVADAGAGRLWRIVPLPGG